jgi:GntR family carbon starvation induced transcriptional regulator
LHKTIFCAQKQDLLQDDFMPASLQRTSLASQAYEALRSSIVSGQLQPGEKLKIDVLRQSHALSSSPLREALNRLVADGLVTADEGKGFRASEISTDDLRDLTTCRTIQEVGAFGAAIERGDDAWEAHVVGSFHQLQKIEIQISQGLATRDDVWTDRHKTFHMALIAACGSERLAASCANLFDQSERYRRLSAGVRERPRDTVGEHQTLVQCVLQRDPQKGRELLRQHIEKTTENLLLFFEQRR